MITPSSVPRVKRKAKKTSPDAVTPSDEESDEADFNLQRVPYVALRKLRPRK